MTFYYYVIEYKKTPTLVKAAVGACIITVFEFFVGLIVNLWYGWNVWDYSGKSGNILGQICPSYTLIWFFVSLAILIISSILYSLYQAFRGGK